MQFFAVAAVKVRSFPFQPRLRRVIEKDYLSPAIVVMEASEVPERIYKVSANRPRLKASPSMCSETRGHQSCPRRRMSATRHWVSSGRITSMSRQAFRLVLVTLKVNSDGLTFSPS